MFIKRAVLLITLSLYPSMLHAKISGEKQGAPLLQVIEQKLDALDHRLEQIYALIKNQEYQNQEISQGLMHIASSLYLIKKHLPYMCVQKNTHPHETVQAVLVLSRILENQKLCEPPEKELRLKEPLEDARKELYEKYKMEYEKLHTAIRERQQKNPPHGVLYSHMDHIAQKITSNGGGYHDLISELDFEQTMGVYKDYVVRGEDLSLRAPAVGKIVAAFDEPDINGKPLKHIAFQVAPEAHITAPADGLVVFANHFKDQQYVVVIYHGRHVYTLTAKVAKVYVALGQFIKQGELIGQAYKDTPVIFQLYKNLDPVNPLEKIL